MFRGITPINLDAKGRMAMPKRYRDQLVASCEGEMVATIDTEARCLLLYPQHDWEEIQEKIQALPSFNREARRIQRLLIGYASDLELDSNGRLLLPSPLREYANLDKKVMLVGQGKKFEIWSEELWMQTRDEYLAMNADADAVPEELLSLSL